MKTLNIFLIATLIAVFTIGLAGPIAALAAGPAAINFGSAGSYAILAKTGISTTGSTSITGDIGVSPAAASYITGFALTLPAASSFSTSPLVTGKVYAADYADPTPANLTAAVLDMQTAYTDNIGRIANFSELWTGNIGGQTLSPNIYKWTTDVRIADDVTFSGGADDVWIFIITKNFNVESGVKIVLAGGAQAKNVFWVVAGQTTIGTTASFNGNILDQTAIIMNTGATLNGRALAQTAVTLDSNIVVNPVAAAAASVEIIITPIVPEAVIAPPITPMSIVVSSTLGSIIKVNANDRPAVYYVVGGKKYLFVNRATYTTWSADAGDPADSFSSLVKVSQAEFDAIELGGNLVAKPGSLIKFDNDSATYGVATGGKLFQLADIAAQVALYGNVTPIVIQVGFRTSYYDNGNAIGILPANSYKPK
ncbi:MAG: ice-binding family protein [Candidatus Buchananbacteria bacterium]|jgi:hypothetical protein